MNNFNQFLKLLFGFIALLLINQNTFSQTWERIYSTPNNDIGRSVVQTADGGFVTVGFSSGFGATGSVLLTKTDDLGNLLWVSTFGDIGTKQKGFDLALCDDGSFILTGYSHSGAFLNDVYLLKISDTGDEIWSVIYNENEEEFGTSVVQTADNGYAITGYRETATGQEMFVKKTDQNGIELWTQYFEGEGNEIVESSTGELIAIGTTTENAGKEEVRIVRIDVSGIILLNKVIPWIFNVTGHSIVETSDGGMAMTGYIQTTGNADYLKNIYLLKTDASGETLWGESYGAIHKPEVGNSIKETVDGGFVIAGRTADFGDVWGDAYVMKTDSNGVLEWDNAFGYGAEKSDEAWDVNLTDTGGYIIAGETQSYGESASFGGERDLYLIRIDSNGEIPSSGVVIDDLLGIQPQVIINKGKSQISQTLGKTSIIETLLELTQVENAEITLFDMNGHLVDQRSYDETVWTQYKSMVNQKLPMGIYAYRIFDNESLLHSGNILIE